MQERVLTERESLQVIASMIERTKTRLREGAGDMMLIWGYLTVGVAMAVGVLLILTERPEVNWLWMLLFVFYLVGFPRIARRKRAEEGAKSYTDALTDGIWKMTGWTAVLFVLVCLVFQLIMGPGVWSLMLLFPFFVVGAAEAVQGLIVREKSLVVGGGVAMLSGSVTAACFIARVPLMVEWYIPLFIVAIVCMMVIPGHILNAKARRHEGA